MHIKRISAVEAISFAGRSIVNHIRLFSFVLLAGSALIALVVGVIGLLNKSLIQGIMSSPMFQNFQECIGRNCFTVVYESSSPLMSLVTSNFIPLSLSALFLTLLFAGLDFGFKRIALDIYDRNESDVRQLFSEWHATPAGFCSWVLYCLMTWIGFMLFIIPGFIVLLRFAFFPYFIIDKGAGIIDSLKRSYNATENHLWDIFACWIVVKLVVYVCFLSWIGIVLTWPLSTLAYTYVYRQLIAKSGPH